MRLKNLIKACACVYMGCFIALTYPTYADTQVESMVKSSALMQHATSVNASSPNLEIGTKADAIGNILLQAVSLMGIPYRWGGNTPESGMDCSGFIRYVFKKSMGITLPRTVAEMAKVGKRISLSEIQPGDLIFFNTLRTNSHIGMYIGNNKFIQSPRTGEQIQVSDLNGYWRARINGIKRIVQEDENSEGATTVKTFDDIRNQPLPTGSKRRTRHRHRTKSHHTTTSISRKGTTVKHRHKTVSRSATVHKRPHRTRQ